MNLVGIVAIVAVLGVAGGAGVGFACGPPPTPVSLVWLHPTGSAVPATHTWIGCSESGQNTAKLGLSARNLGPGDGCSFSAQLHNAGNDWLSISVVMLESTARGNPPFSSCFGFSLSSGPTNGKIAGGGSYPYTFVIELLSTSTASCRGAVGTVSLTFTGVPY